MGLKNEFYQCVRKDRVQLFLCADLEADDTRGRLESLLPQRCDFVYSDPPWNPGNATYWRTHAGKDPCRDYHRFLDSWVRAVTSCIARGATDVFTEQSSKTVHQNMTHDAISRAGDTWPLPLVEQWEVFYGSPGSASVRYPNALLHYGHERIATDPSGMASEPMTIRVCAGLDFRPGSWVIDPCMGKGMTSRMAVYFDWNCVGVEINQARLDKTLAWLARQGYKISEITHA